MICMCWQGVGRHNVDDAEGDVRNDGSVSGLSGRAADPTVRAAGRDDESASVRESTASVE